MKKKQKPLRKQYEALRKRYELPAFEDVDSEFDISGIELEGSLLRGIRSKVTEKLGDVRCLLEEVLHPETNLVDLCESRVFDEDEKKGLFGLYKRLMVADRHSAELSVLNDEKLEAAFIKSFYSEWKGLKPELVKFIRKLKESWEKETEEGETAGYMG